MENKINHSKYWTELLSIFEEHFEKGEKCPYCGEKSLCRGKAVFMLAKVELLLKNDENEGEKKEINIFEFFNIWEKERFPKYWFLFHNEDGKRKTGNDFIKAIDKAKVRDTELMTILEYFCQDFEKYQKMRDLENKVDEKNEEKKPWKSIPDFTKMEKPKTTTSNHGKIVSWWIRSDILGRKKTQRKNSELDKMLDILG